MIRKLKSILAVLAFLAAAACTMEGVQRGLYESLYQRQCMDNAKLLNCDPQHKTYNQYEQDFKDLQKADR